jgi:hypothetical protein
LYQDLKLKLDPHDFTAAGASPLEDHWSLRRQAAALLAAIAAQFAAPHHSLVPRLCRVLVQAFLDPSKQLSSKYGAVVGLQVGTKSMFLVVVSAIVAWLCVF